MQTFFNFTTKTVVNPLEKITHFFNSPYMPDNMRLLNLAKKLEKLPDVTTSVTENGHIVILFPIEVLVNGDCLIQWKSEDSFCINRSIYCKIVGVERNIVRIDTVRF